MADQDSAPPTASANDLELQRSSQEFIRELERMGHKERREWAMSAADDRRLPLAREIEDATIGLVGLSRYQTRLIEMERQALGEASKGSRKPALILREWRAAEVDLRDARAALERATDVADRLRDEHRQSVRSVLRSDGARGPETRSTPADGKLDQ